MIKKKVYQDVGFSITNEDRNTWTSKIRNVQVAEKARELIQFHSIPNYYRVQ